MRQGDNEVLKKTLNLVRLFAFPAVGVLIVTVVLLLGMSFIKLSVIIRLFVAQTNILDLHSTEVSAIVLSIIDVYLLVIVVYIMAVALYKFFINGMKTDSWLILNSLNDLKSYIASMVVLFLIIFTVKKIVEWKDSTEILYYGVIISLICAVLIWYCIYLGKCRKDDHRSMPQKEPKISNGDGDNC